MTGRRDQLCACGCGQPTEIATKTSHRDGLIAGQPKRYIHGHNARRGVPGGVLGARLPRSSAQPAEEYAEQLAHRSALIVGAVHDEGPEAVLHAIREALALDPPPGVDPWVALVTVLAAQIPTTARLGDLLAWTTAAGLRSPGPAKTDRGAA